LENIYVDNVGFLYNIDNKMPTINIKDKYIATEMRAYFNYMWGILKK